MSGSPSSTNGPARRARVSRWDRPKPPKDWHYWVGGTGRVLITIGLLMFAFVAYQLWGTGIQTARAQDRLDRQFEHAVQANGGQIDGSTVPATGATSPGNGTEASSPPLGGSTPASGSTVAGGSTPIDGSVPTGLGGLGLGLTEPPRRATPSPSSSSPGSASTGSSSRVWTAAR